MSNISTHALHRLVHHISHITRDAVEIPNNAVAGQIMDLSVGPANQEGLETH